jgi:hypothetical protein
MTVDRVWAEINVVMTGRPPCLLHVAENFLWFGPGCRRGAVDIASASGT